MTELREAWARAEALLNESLVARYAFAAGATLLMLLLRAAFDPVLSPGAYYFLYYPGVVLIAYALGLGPGILAITLAGLMSYFAFSQPAFAIKIDLRANLRLVLFLVSASVLALVAASVRDRLRRLSEHLADASALTHAQATLFRNHADRVAGHLQLLSALLQLKADKEPAVDYSRVLMNAASRTMLISRIHRSFAGSAEEPVKFSAFAERLADAALEARGRPPIIISVEGELSVLPEQATSLAIMLLECINARANNCAPGLVRIILAQQANEGVLTVVEKVPPGMDMGPPDAHLLGAVAEQMGGRIVLGRNEERGVLRFAFPRDLQALPTWHPLEPLH